MLSISAARSRHRPLVASWPIGFFPLDPNSPFNMRSPATLPDLTDNFVGCEAVIHGQRKITLGKRPFRRLLVELDHPSSVNDPVVHQSAQVPNLADLPPQSGGVSN